MVITIASGKGGTGKTTFAVNLAYALARRGENVRLLDCDVEEPNDHLFVKPQFTDIRPVTVPKPVWNPDLCTGCGACAQACHYNAIAVVKGKVLIFNELCHSCGVCSHVCPENAISEREVPVGTVSAAPDHTPFFFAHGMLNIGEALAPNVVRGVKEHLRDEAVNIIDAAPGTACPVVEAVTDADAVLLVTEPTPFGLNDLKLAVGLVLKLGVPAGIIVNRSDGQDSLIVDYAREVGLPIAGRIPFRRAYAEAYSRGDILVDGFPELRDNLLGIYDDLLAARRPELPQEVFELSTEDSGELPRGTAETHREITVISGKGGTGKTTVTASLAQLAGEKIMADTDVDAADLHLLLTPTVREGHDFVGGTRATIDPDACIACGRCADACRFHAIRRRHAPADAADDHQVFEIEQLACEGCGLCALVCPVDAVQTEENVTGRWYISTTKNGPMVHARLGIAEENSGRLVARVRNEAAKLVRDLKQPLILADGPPGTGCPVIASVSGTDLVVVVTEPTVSGVHDMERVMQLAAHFGVPVAVVINKADLNSDQADRIDTIAAAHGSRVIGRIPFSSVVNDALMAGQTVIDYGDSDAAHALRAIWAELENHDPGR